MEPSHPAWTWPTVEESREAATAILHACERLAFRARRLEEDHELHGLRRRLMKRLLHQHNLPLANLADYEGVSLTALSKTVSALERSGWVRRQPDPADGRSVLVAATENGRRRVEVAQHNSIGALTAVVKQTPPETVRSLVEAAELYEIVAYAVEAARTAWR